MFNFKTLKNTVLLFLLLLCIFFAYLLFLSYKNTPVIKEIGNINIDDFVTEKTLINNENYVLDKEIEINFNYKLIGIRSGGENSSVIVKKANEEYLVVIGQLLENTFELVEVKQNSAVFRNGKKMYRINKDDDK